MTEVGTLTQRLASLRRQSGAQAPAPVADRLRRLGGRAVATPPLDAGQRRDDGAIAAALGGVPVAKGLIRVERTCPAGFLHGRFPVGRRASTSEAHLFDVPASGVFMDTETTGLAGGTGTLAFLVGLGRFVDGGLEVCQYFLTGFGAEPLLLEAVADWFADAAVIVSFNGKCFDGPLLSTRYRLAGLADPFSGLDHLDLLYPLRRAYQGRWPDCRLQTAERCLLGFHRQGDLPGAEVPAVWSALVRHGVLDRVPDIVEHNYWDLVSLAALPAALEDAYEEPDRYGADVGAVARWHREHGDARKAVSCLEARRGERSAHELLELAHLHRRHGRWAAAVAIWEDLAEQGCLEAVERLAKYHEHVSRDYATALDLANRLVDEGTEVAHARRRRRIEGKLRSASMTQGLLDE